MHAHTADGRPADPLVILGDFPERERGEFLRQYRQAVDAAHDPAGYYEELATARAGTATTVPVTDAIPDWTERVAAAQGRR